MSWLYLAGLLTVESELVSVPLDFNSLRQTFGLRFRIGINAGRRSRRKVVGQLLCTQGLQLWDLRFASWNQFKEGGKCSSALGSKYQYDAEMHALNHHWSLWIDVEFWLWTTCCVSQSVEPNECRILSLMASLALELPEEDQGLSVATLQGLEDSCIHCRSIWFVFIYRKSSLMVNEKNHVWCQFTIIDKTYKLYYKLPTCMKAIVLQLSF